MDRELLKRYLDEGLSLIEIGVLTNRDSSTVGYWVNKFGLEANGKDKYAPRGGLTREQLEPLVESGATLKEMAEAVSPKPSTVRHWMKRHGLELERARRLLDVPRGGGPGSRPCVGQVHGATACGVRS